MSRHGFRFVHATCLNLDEPLIGTGALSPDERELAEDATFHAWDEIVNTCVKAQVEFLILTGNSFNSRTNSLRARVALEKGFEKLAAHDISVFVVPGPLDPLNAWRRRLNLPPNVTLLADEDHEPVAVISQQKVLASIFIVTTGSPEEARWNNNGASQNSKGLAPFRIGVVPAGTPVRWVNGQPAPLDSLGVSATAAAMVRTALEHHTDYLALGEGMPRTESTKAGVVHDPGSAQSLSGEGTGSRGCSIVNVGPQGHVSIDAVATAPVRWEEVSFQMERHTNWNDLVERMALALMERVADNDERLWIINWKLSGEGTVYDSLAKKDKQQELWKLLEAELTGERDVHRVHRLERVTHTIPDLPKQQGTSGTGLMAQFEQILNESPGTLLEQTRRELLEIEWLKRPEFKIVQESIQGVSQRRVLERTRKNAERWFD